jgi:hypothetical protein
LTENNHTQKKTDMNDKDHAVYEALLRVNRFGADRSGDFDPGTNAAADFAAAAALEIAITVDDFGPGTPASDATGAKNSLLSEVWEDLKAIAATARRIGKKEPGFDTPYRLGDDTQREIIATADAFLLLLADPATAAKFTAFSMPATFIADIQADIDTIKGKKGEQTDARTGDAGETALTRTQIRQARDLIADLNSSVRNKFRTDPEVLAEWSTASRIHRTGRRRTNDTPPPQPPIV